MLTKDYLGILTPKEVEDLRSKRSGNWIHPVVSLALDSTRGVVAANTERAGRIVLQANEAWLNSLRQRLLETSDLTNASSALGEIRAYGSLLETGMVVKPAPAVSGKPVSPEFEVQAGDGPVIVEVHSKQMHPAERKKLDDQHKRLQAKVAQAIESGEKSGEPQNEVVADAAEIQPLGAADPNKAGDSDVANGISRVAGIKDKEKQIDHQKPFVLWLDMQDPAVWGLPLAQEQLLPIYSLGTDGHVGAGILWHALYGRKGEPYISMQGFDFKAIPMLHEGRFYQTMKAHGGPTRISAIVISLPETVALMEHPEPIMRLPSKFRQALTRITAFRLEYSHCDWMKGRVKSDIAANRRKTQATIKALLRSNPP